MVTAAFVRPSCMFEKGGLGSTAQNIRFYNWRPDCRLQIDRKRRRFRPVVAQDRESCMTVEKHSHPIGYQRDQLEYRSRVDAFYRSWYCHSSADSPSSPSYEEAE